MNIMPSTLNFSQIFIILLLNSRSLRVKSLIHIFQAKSMRKEAPQLLGSISQENFYYLQHSFEDKCSYSDQIAVITYYSTFVKKIQKMYVMTYYKLPREIIMKSSTRLNFYNFFSILVQGKSEKLEQLSLKILTKKLVIEISIIIRKYS